MEFRATKEGKHHYPFSSTSSGFVGPEENSNNGEEAVPGPVEKEHMFDKVVTPSDVGKLNRLVIPKQHAERYFPLDSSSTEKGLLLNFEDRGGKMWRFRYSYWNSSQSYVITKGWSRFVKEKQLDAGDIVSFQRGVGESGRNRLFIDWRRRRLENVVGVHNSRQEQPLVSMVNMNYYHGLVSRGSGSWVNPNFPRVSHGDIIRSYHAGSYGYGGGAVGSMMKKPMVFESVPVVQVKRKVESKRLRLFGVNMECPMTESDEKIQPPNNYLHHHRGVSVLGSRLLDKGKSSMSFDLGC